MDGRHVPVALLWVASFFLVAVSQAPVVRAAAEFTILNYDEPGEGLNDSTPVAPVGGNSGTTLGQQRTIALQFAANLWGVELDSPLSIEIRSEFSVLEPCGILAQARPGSTHRDFLGVPLANTWYPAALANKLAGIDLSTDAEIYVEFSSSSCFDWYYGLDASPPSGALDFVTVALHELGHGLGFVSNISHNTGNLLFGYSDSFSQNFVQPGVGPFISMTSAQRLTAIEAGEVFWDGAHVVAANGGNAHLDSYMDHWAATLIPAEVLAPFYTDPIHDPGLALAAFLDMGWTLNETGSSCGNGILEGIEACDGTNLGGASCSSQGFYCGSVSCNPDCTLDTTTCVEGFCGDGLLQCAEVCEENSDCGPGQVCTPNCGACSGPACTNLDGDGFFEEADCGTAPDCNDSDAAVYPGASEVCNGTDDDCDGEVDEGCSSGGTCAGQCGGESQGCWCDEACAQYGDCCADVCSACSTLSHCGSSCTPEVCDGIDNDCDGVIDEDFVSAATSCGVGACSATGQTQCVNGVIENTCTPGSPSAELCCNNLDEDCDGTIDNGCPPCGAECAGQCGGQSQGCWCDEACAQAGDCCTDVCSACSTLSHCGPACTDLDGDSFAVETACGPTQDCDDADAATHPGASEVCGDGKDNNCDTIVDEGCPTAGECADQCGGQAPSGCWCDEVCAQYGDCCAEACSDCSSLSHCEPVCTDQDGDSFALEPSCGPTQDCDDTDAATHPGALEICGDGKDNNCDSIVDEGCPTTGECAGQCGGQTAQGCWCDEACTQWGDCCAEVCSDCSSLSHCAP